MPLASGFPHVYFSAPSTARSAARSPARRRWRRYCIQSEALLLFRRAVLAPLPSSARSAAGVSTVSHAVLCYPGFPPCTALLAPRFPARSAALIEGRAAVAPLPYTARSAVSLNCMSSQQQHCLGLPHARALCFKGAASFPVCSSQREHYFSRPHAPCSAAVVPLTIPSAER